MSGPFKSLSIAEYSGHLIQNGLQSENMHTFSDLPPAVANLFCPICYILCISDFCDRMLKIKHDS